MKIQLAYRVTGEERGKVIETVKKICSALNEAGYETYCPILNPDSHGKVEDAFNKLKENDAILALIKSDDKSEGMLLEIGYAIAKGKKFILVIKKSVKDTRTREMADYVIEFETLDELYDKLRRLRI